MSKTLIKITNDLNGKRKTLIITSGVSKDLPNVFRASNNIKNVDLLSADLLNTYEILKYKNLLFMKESIDILGDLKKE